MKIIFSCKNVNLEGIVISNKINEKAKCLTQIYKLVSLNFSSNYIYQK